MIKTSDDLQTTLVMVLENFDENITSFLALHAVDFFLYYAYHNLKVCRYFYDKCQT